MAQIVWQHAILRKMRPRGAQIGREIEISRKIEILRKSVLLTPRLSAQQLFTQRIDEHETQFIRKETSCSF